MQIILEEEAGRAADVHAAGAVGRMIRSYGNAMAGDDGLRNLEKNVQALVDIQNKLQEQSKAFYDSNKVGPEVWTQFVNMQAPMLQSMMSSLHGAVEDLFMQMQENMSKQARSMFSGFQFPAREQVSDEGAAPPRCRAARGGDVEPIGAQRSRGPSGPHGFP